MKKITVSEFDELLYATTFLKYYWTVFLGLKIDPNYPNAPFIRDFIESERLSQYSNVKRSTFNKILLTEEQYHDLQKCATITEELKAIIWDNPH